ncbi:MAG: O-antigen ligase family protein [Candidatus Nanoarchaeia archaeon]
MGFIHFSLASIYFFIVAKFFSDNKADYTKKFSLFITCLGILHASYGLCQAFGWDFLRLGPETKSIFNIRPNGFTKNPDYYGELLVLLAFPPLGLLIQSLFKKKFMSAVLPSIAFVLVFAALVASMTRSSWLGFLFGSAFFALSIASIRKSIGLKKLFFISLTTALLLGIAISCIVYFVPKYRTFVGKKIESMFTLREYNYYAKTTEKTVPSQRPILWRDTLRFCKHQLENGRYTGVGIENFTKYFMPFMSGELRQSSIKLNFDNPHSMPLYMFATCGIIGLVAYLFLMFSVVSASFSGVFSDFIPTDERIIFSSYASSLIAYLINLLFFFDDITTITLFFIFSGILCAMMLKYSPSYSIGTEKKKGIFAKFADLPFIIPSKYCKWLSVSVLSIFTMISIFACSDFIMRGFADYYYEQGVLIFQTEKGKPSLETLGKAISNFHKAVSFYPEETYYSIGVIREKAQKVKHLIAQDKRKEAFAEYREVVDIAQRIENRIWCPNELYTKVGAAALFLGLLTDSIRAFEESLKWDRFYIEGRYILALQYSALAEITEDIDALYASFFNAGLACELLKYFPYVKPEYFKFAFKKGIEIYRIDKNPVVLQKMAELLFMNLQYADSNKNDEEIFKELEEISRNTPAQDSIKLSSIIYDCRMKKITSADAIKSIQALKIEEEKKRKGIELLSLDRVN